MKHINPLKFKKKTAEETYDNSATEQDGFQKVVKNQ